MTDVAITLTQTPASTSSPALSLSRPNSTCPFIVLHYLNQEFHIFRARTLYKHSSEKQNGVLQMAVKPGTAAILGGYRVSRTPNPSKQDLPSGVQSRASAVDVPYIKYWARPAWRRVNIAVRPWVCRNIMALFNHQPRQCMGCIPTE